MTTPANKNRVEIPKKDEDVVQWWRDRINRGIKWRWMTSGKNDCHWYRYKSYYRGDWGAFGNDMEVFSRGDFNLDAYLPTNRVFSYIRSTVPKIYFRNPGVYISKGITIEGVDDAGIIQDAAMYLTRELDLKHVIKSSVLNTLITGTGVVKRGFGSLYVSGEQSEEEKERSLEHSTRVKKGLPWARAVDPVNFVVPFGTKRFDDADWCAHGVWRPLEYAQDDKNYAHRDQFKATKVPKFAESLKGSGDTSDGEQYFVRLWEIHDKATGRLLIISDGSTAIHYKGDDVLQIEGLPFDILTFDENPDSMWAISTVKIMEPQQLELNDIRTMQSRYRKRDFTKIAVDPVIGDGAIQELNNADEPMAAVKVPDPNKNIRLITSQMPPDLARAAEEADNDMRLELGFSRNQAGEVSTGRRTAREIEVARQAAEIRNDERRDATSDFYANMVNGIMQSSFLLMDASMVKKITGGAVWHARDRDLLPYDLGLEVNPEESQPKSSSVERAEALELYQQMIQNPVVVPVTPTAQVLDAYNEDVRDWIDPEISQAIAVVLQLREQKAKRAAGGGQSA